MRVLVVGATDEAIDFIRNIMSRGHEAIVLDDSKARIDRVVQEFDITAYQFSIMDLSPLVQAGIYRADVVLAAHPVDTVNILVCVYAKHFNVPKIIALVNTQQAATIIEKLGLAHTIVVKSRIAAESFIGAFYGVKVMELDDENYVMLLEVKEGSHIEGKTVDDIEAEGAKLIAIISRDGNLVGPTKDYRLKHGDRALVIVKKDKIESVLFKH